MRDDEDKCRFSEEELAVSMRRAFISGLGTILPQNADHHFPQGEDSIFLLAARHAGAFLDQGEGVSFSEIAKQLWAVVEMNGLADTLNGDVAHHAWEAAVRHLASLYFADDEINVEELERSWKGWVNDRLQKVGAA